MPQNYFITGLPKAGKTTLLRSAIEDLKGRGLYVGGFISPEEKRSGKRTGFLVSDIESGKSGVLADLNCDGPKVSKYHVDIKSFEGIALMSLADFEKYDVVIIDEIGWMETKSRKFLDALDKILDSPTPLVASLHEDFVDKFDVYGKVYELSESNREQVYNDLIGEIKAITKKAAKPGKAVQAPKAAKKAKAQQPEEQQPGPRVRKPKKAKAPARKQAVAEKAPEPVVSEKEPAQVPMEEQKEPERAPKPAHEAKHEPEKKKKGLVDRIKGLLGL